MLKYRKKKKISSYQKFSKLSHKLFIIRKNNLLDDLFKIYSTRNLKFPSPPPNKYPLIYSINSYPFVLSI